RRHRSRPQTATHRGRSQGEVPQSADRLPGLRLQERHRHAGNYRMEVAAPVRLTGPAQRVAGYERTPATYLVLTRRLPANAGEKGFFMSLATIPQISPVQQELEQRMDQLCINTIRTLSIDAIQAANSGHPGTPMGMAPVAYTLWQEFLRFDPQDPVWPNRDRFVLSAGHASMLLYSLLHLSEVRAVSKDYETLGEPSV